MTDTNVFSPQKPLSLVIRRILTSYLHIFKGRRDVTVQSPFWEACSRSARQQIFHRTLRFSIRHLNPSWARWIQYTPSHHIYLRYILILSSHLRIRLPSRISFRVSLQQYFSSSLCAQTGSGAHPASCTMGTGGPFPGGKERPRRKADHLHLVLRLRMSRGYTSSPPKRLSGV
jgi:hypothetical protein